MNKKETNRCADRIKALAQFYIDHKVMRGFQMFEEACGLSRFYIKNLYNTVNGNAGTDNIAKIYKTFKGVNLHWLVLGEGNMFEISEVEALRNAELACEEAKKDIKIRNILNNKLLKGMTREEKLDFVDKLLNDEK